MADTAPRSRFPLFDLLRPTGEHARAEYRPAVEGRTWGIPLLVGLALLVVSAVGWAVEPAQFYYSYLTGWMFCLTIALGALFFVMVNHIVKARWVVAVRRVPEALLWAFPLLAVAIIPILFGMHDLYHWTHEELYDPTSDYYDPILVGKRSYLNTPFWLVRVAVYFAVWTYLAYRLYGRSIDQDVHPDPETPARHRFTSAWGIPVFAVTTSFASYDLLMSLDPHWFSTIWGVYLFAGSFMSALATTILLYAILQRGGGLRRVVTVEHYHDLGKLLFGFVAFWAYIAFSQYMLIWYGNLAEETIFYQHRWEHGWQYFTYALVYGHFAIPFLGLLPRASKRILPLLSFWAVYMLVMHWIDLLWIVSPVHAFLFDVHHARFHWLDFTCWLGLALCFGALTLYRLGRHSLIPQNDPYLAESLRFENV